MKRTVRVILLQDVPSLGQKDQLRSVRFGFAKNWLIPEKLAMLATPALTAQIQRNEAAKAERAQKEAHAYGECLQALNGFILRVRPKKTQKGTLYAALTSEFIARKLKEKGIPVEKQFIALEQPIKRVGEYDILIKFTQDYQTSIKIIVQ